MLINTRDFGEIEVDDSDIFDFPVGIYGFENARQFALLSPLGEDVYPMWLQCTTSVKPCFIVFDPMIIDGLYKVSLTDEEVELLNITPSENPNVRTLVIAKVPENYRDTTVNMKSPIVINLDTNTAAQIIQPYDYSFRFGIYEPLETEE